MAPTHRATLSHPMAIVGGFLAGFFATLIFHQLAVAFLWSLHFAPGPAYQMTPRPPLGVPAVFSLAFWGGIWGILFAYLSPFFGKGAGYWVKALLFGGIFPSLVALLLVVPLKGGPIGAGWQIRIWCFAFIVNACWGVGTALLLGLARRVRPGGPISAN